MPSSPMSSRRESRSARSSKSSAGSFSRRVELPRIRALSLRACLRSLSLLPQEPLTLRATVDAVGRFIVRKVSDRRARLAAAERLIGVGDEPMRARASGASPHGIYRFRARRSCAASERRCFRLSFARRRLPEKDTFGTVLPSTSCVTGIGAEPCVCLIACLPRARRGAGADSPRTRWRSLHSRSAASRSSRRASDRARGRPSAVPGTTAAGHE